MVLNSKFEPGLEGVRIMLERGLMSSRIHGARMGEEGSCVRSENPIRICNDIFLRDRRSDIEVLWFIL